MHCVILTGIYAECADLALLGAAGPVEGEAGITITLLPDHAFLS